MFKKNLILLFVLLSGLSVFAQKHKRSVEIGVFLGGSYYIGDLNPSHHLNEFTKPAGGFLIRYNINSRLSARLNALFGKIEAHDSYSDSPFAQQRNLNFKSQISEFSLQAEFNFLDYEMGDEKNKFSPYIFLGIGVFHFSPQAKVGDNWIDLQPLGTEGQGLAGGASSKKYKLTQISIPFGVGIKTHLAKNIGLSLEWGMRKTFTDYLDDVSTKYYDPKVLAQERGTTAAQLSDTSIGTDPTKSNVGRQRGNPTNNDWYAFVGMGLTIKLKPKTKKCPGVGY